MRRAHVRSAPYIVYLNKELARSAGFQLRNLLAATRITDQPSANMRRPLLHLSASLLTTAVLVAGCGGTPDRATSGSMAASESPSDVVSPQPAPGTAHDREVRNVVDAYIHERTIEGAPYYIDSSATEFAGYEDRVVRREDRAICRAKFTSAKDVYYLQFILAKEMGRYVIHQVVLEKLNELPVRKTLYNRDTLVL